MENILDKINAAYKKGIEDPRYQKAINEMIINPEIEAAKASKEIVAGREASREGRGVSGEGREIEL